MYSKMNILMEINTVMQYVNEAVQSLDQHQLVGEDETDQLAPPVLAAMVGRRSSCRRC